MAESKVDTSQPSSGAYELGGVAAIAILAVSCFGSFYLGQHVAFRAMTKAQRIQRKWIDCPCARTSRIIKKHSVEKRSPMKDPPAE